MRIIFLLFIPLFIFSCSNLTQEEEKTSTTYSKETNKTFEAIERSQVKNYVEDLHQTKSSNKLSEKKEPTTNVSPIAIQEVKLKGNPNTIRELNQVLSFHCMKHRKRFKSEQSCIEKVNSSLKKCEIGQKKVTPQFVRCLKDELKKI